MTKHLRYLCALLLLAVASVGWAEESITYTFQSKSWTAVLGNSSTPANWTSGKDGAGFAASQGVQVTSNASGANATSPISYSNISKIVVVYNTNKSAGQGVVKIQVGDNTEKSNNVAYSGSGDGRYANYTTEFDNINQSGFVKLTVTCSTNSIYIHQIIITYGASAPTVAAPAFSPADGTTFGDEGLEVSISQADNKAIYYTLDGSDPDNTSSQYAAPFTINATTTVKAIAYDGTNASTIATATYTYVDPNAPGTQNNPYTVAQARAAIDAGTGTQGVYATGIVSKIVTPYNETYGNISFDISSDGEMSSAQLRAYRCKKADGENTPSVDGIEVGDVVVVYGNLTKYGDTYEFAENNVLVSLVHPVVTNPVINANNVNLAYNATSGSIAYTIDNPVEGTTLNAATNADWISNITVGTESVTFTTTANEGTEDREATFTLTYQGAQNKTVTVTQGHFVVDYAILPFSWAGGASADLIALNGVTANGLGSDYAAGNAPYLIKFDGTGDYIQVKTNERPGIVTIGVKMLGGDNESKITVQGSADGETFTNIQDLTISGAQNTTLTLETTNDFAETDRYVRLLFTKGSNVGIGPISIAESSTEPFIIAENVELDYDTTSGEIAYQVKNAVDGEALYASTTASWISDIIVTSNKVVFTTEVNNGPSRTAKITLFYEGAEDKEVTVTQKNADFAVLPFAFNGGKEDIVNTNGLTQSGLGSDYNNSPYLKFDHTDDYLILKMNEAPKALVFDIKGNGFSDGTFKVQTSADGSNYTDLATYEELASNVQTKSINITDTDVRYIKWIYNEKVNGNVALGNIIAANVSLPEVPTFDKESGTYPAGTLVTITPPEGMSVALTFAFADGSDTWRETTSDPRTTILSKDITITAKTSYKFDANMPALYSEVITRTYTIETIPVTINKKASDASGLCYGTLYYGKFNLVVPEGLTAYTYKVTDGTLMVSKTYATDAVIPAGTAVVVKTATTLTNDTEDYDFAVTTEGGVADADNMLHGTDGAATTNAGEGNWKYYALSLNSSNTPGTVGFYYRQGCSDGQAFNNGEHKAYLAVPVSQTGGAKGFAFNDATTTINGVAFGVETNNAAIYNLNGQRVNKAQKGVYIVNGKKVVIK